MAKAVSVRVRPSAYRKHRIKKRVYFMLAKILVLLLAAFFLWWIIRYFKANPKAFSAKNLNKSFFTMGILALILIAFIALLVFFLR